MDIIKSQIEKSSDTYKENKSFHLGLRDQLREKLAHIKLGGGQKSVDRHLSREKLLPRQRIEKVLDEGSAFIELSSLAASGMYEMDVPSAGIVCGIGRVHGIECMFVANDATVKGGTYYPVTIKKHLRANYTKHEILKKELKTLIKTKCTYYFGF